MSLYGRYSGVNGFGSMNGHRLGQADAMPFDNGGGSVRLPNQIDPGNWQEQIPGQETSPDTGSASTVSLVVTVGGQAPINGLAEVYRFENVWGGVRKPVLAGRIPLDSNGRGTASFNLPPNTPVKVIARADNAQEADPRKAASGVTASGSFFSRAPRTISLDLMPLQMAKPSITRYWPAALGIAAAAYFISRK